MKLFHSAEEKEAVINDMNLKYRYPRDICFPLVELYRLQIRLPPEDSDEEDGLSRPDGNSSIAELLNERTSETSTLKSSSFYQRMEN